MNITKDMIGRKILFAINTLEEEFSAVFGKENIYEGRIIEFSTDGRYVKIAMTEPVHRVEWFSTMEINIISTLGVNNKNENNKIGEYL